MNVYSTPACQLLVSVGIILFLAVQVACHLFQQIYCIRYRQGGGGVPSATACGSTRRGAGRSNYIIGGVRGRGRRCGSESPRTRVPALAGTPVLIIVY